MVTEYSKINAVELRIESGLPLASVVRFPVRLFDFLP